MKTVNEKSVKPFLKGKGLKVLLFTKNDCAVCDASKASLNDLSDLDFEVSEVGSKESALRKNLNVRFNPTVLLLSDGEEIERLELVPAKESGALYKKVLESYLVSNEEEE